jgi:tRNA threonylcarbamoyladenosine biosynthesis protein TsaB
MIVLGFDTSTSSTVVGLRLTGANTYEARDDPEGGERPGHATRLLPLAHGLLCEAGLGWDAITRIAVGVGPGTFTGLRIGVASARAIAQSLCVELVGVSSLRALSYAANMDTFDQRTGVLPVIDARRGEVFAAAYEGELELIAPQALPPNEVGELIERGEARTSLRSWIAVGDGAVRYRGALERPNLLVPDLGSVLHRIEASAICELGAQATCADTPVLPDYRRRPDAEITLEGAAS